MERRKSEIKMENIKILSVTDVKKILKEYKKEM